MEKYYFADTCLLVTDINNALCNRQLVNFRNISPFSSEIVLDVSAGAYPQCNGLTPVFEGSGIKVSNINDEKWLISSEGNKNGCFIEADHDYSRLQGFTNKAQSNSDRVLPGDFLQLLRIAAECHMAQHSGVSLHASCICFNGRSVLFTAPAGTGKSTHANIWKEHLGAKVINGDRPFLRLSRDGVRAYGVPWDGKEQIFLQEDHPVTAIVEIRRAKSNIVRRLSCDQAFKLLMKQCFIPMWDDAVKFSVMQSIKAISKIVPVYRLFCLPEASAAELMRDVLFNDQKARLKREQADMKLKEGFVLKYVLDEWIVMPAGSNIEKFEAAIVLNEVAAFIWKQLENSISKEDLLQTVLDEFDIDEETASNDLNAFLEKLAGLELLQVS